jgi:hypothetical protein
MRRTVCIISIASLAVPFFFPALCYKRHDFVEKVTECKMRVLIFRTTLSKTFLILRINERYIINVRVYSYKEAFMLIGL